MEKQFEKVYHNVEIEHWWFKSRRNFILNLLKHVPRNSKVLDIGCSSGVFLKELEQKGFNIDNLYGIDISEEAIQNCKKNGIKNAFVMDGQNITLHEKFDIIIASDCLEHLQNDSQAIKNWKSLLHLNGRMYVFVPAFMSLWSYHDTVNMHYRRYTKAELLSKMKQEKLTIHSDGYWNVFLFLPVFLFRKGSALLNKNKSGESDISIGNSWVNHGLYWLLLAENKLLSVLRFPFGVSTYCIAARDD